MPDLKRYPIDWNGEPRWLDIPRENVVAEIGMNDLPPLADPWAAMVRAILVCDGIPPEEARAYGFAFCTPSFDEALALALQERGRDARIAVNRVDNSYATPPGRPVAWREG